MPHNVKSVRIFTTRTYERAVRKLMSEVDRQKMEAAIIADLARAPLLRGTGGIRKLRWTGLGRGKRGGIRTIYFHHAGPEAIYMLTAYAKAGRDDLTRRRQKNPVAAGGPDQERGGKPMTTERRTQVGQEVEAALGEVLAHVRGEVDLPCRIVDDPAAERILALRKRMKLSRQKFADRFGLDARAVQEWEQGRRIPDRAARVLLTVIDRDPEAVARALNK